jgi:hypothetical protein
MAIESIEGLDRAIDLGIHSTPLQNSSLHRATHAVILKMFDLELRKREEVTGNLHR